MVVVDDLNEAGILALIISTAIVILVVYMVGKYYVAPTLKLFSWSERIILLAVAVGIGILVIFIQYRSVIH